MPSPIERFRAFREERAAERAREQEALDYDDDSCEVMSEGDRVHGDPKARDEFTARLDGPIIRDMESRLPLTHLRPRDRGRDNGGLER